MNGIIALDIDGTITVDERRLEIPVKKYIENLIEKDWEVILLTGRTFSFSKPILNCIDASFLCSFQNGASLMRFPEMKMIKKNYLSIQILSGIKRIFDEFKTGFLVESGVENQDQCFFRWNDFPIGIHSYLKYRISISPESWIPIENFDQINLKEFAVIKFFSDFEKAQIIGKNIEAAFKDIVKVTVIRDPFNPGSYLAHVNQIEASKGKALKFFSMQHKRKLPIIVAGDDYNDIEMLKEGDVKVVMQNAPQDVQKIADVIAPNAKDLGIIQGLESAFKLLQAKK